MGYIKSHSNYVLQKKHQDTNDGTIYERDITTIGGLNQFAKGQIPIYQSGNFIITVRNDNQYIKDYSNIDWEKNSSANNIWTLENTTSVNNNSQPQIVVTRDYYDLRDFAYYGSCSELIRSSLNDIINNFPGELYSPKIDGKGISMFYTDKYNPNEDQTEILKDWYLLDNPFGINIHSQQFLTNEANPLRYFCHNGFKQYEIISPSGEHIPITSWEVNYTPCQIEQDGSINPIWATIELNGKYTINVVKGDSNAIIYLVNTNFLDFHIRPKEELINEYFKTLDEFKKILLNRNSNPIYTANFEIIKENEFGYYTEIIPFTFPLGFGGYNLAINDAAYSVYLNDLVDIASFYDEYFCDNLYRSMTHESIKNFDWTSSRINDNENLDEYLLGGSKLQKTIRLIGREFDEIKNRANLLFESSFISYNSITNTSTLLNNLLTDGWDLKSIIPLKKNDNNDYITDNITIQPYDSSNACFKDGYFITCDDNNSPFYAEASESSTYQVINGILKTKIKQYFNDKIFSNQDLINYFFKILKLNSKNIWLHKGSIEGLEILLGLFGLRSKRWYEKQNINKRVFKPFALAKDSTQCQSTNTYDYEIIEYVVASNSLIDKQIGDEYQYDKYNKSKTIVYDTDDYRNGVYNSYQGLPLKYYDIDGKRYLVPFYDPNMIIDGNPYYQMFGGWLGDGNGNFEETCTSVLSVNNIKELLSIPFKELENNIIYYVKNLQTNYIIIDGYLYELHTEEYNNTIYDYFSVNIYQNSVRVGRNIYLDNIVVSSPYGYGDKILEETFYFDDYQDGDEIRIYLLGNDKQCTARNTFNDEIIYLNRILFYNSKVFGTTTDINDLTHYFQLINVNNKNELSNNGWKQLNVNDTSYKKIASLKNYKDGNNPHCSNFSYDNGEQYLEYFKHIFKYACETKEFDLRCYHNQTIDDIINLVYPIGFTLQKVASDKVNFIGNYHQIDGNTKTTFFYNNTKNQNNEYNFLSSNTWKSKLNKTILQSKTGFSEQIINIKNVDLIFTDINDDYQYYIKNVILHYISQILPSNIILNIKFKERN